MIQDIFPKEFNNAYKPVSPEDKDLIFIYRGQGKADTDILLIKRDTKLEIPTFASIKDLVNAESMQYLFAIDEVKYYLYTGDAESLRKKIFDGAGEKSAEILNNNFVFEKIGIFRRHGDNEFALTVTTAFHLYTWYSKNRFCGMCGKPTFHDEKERALKCPECGNVIYPVIAPAVIIGLIKRKGFVEPDGTVTQEDRIMVSRYAFREYRGMALLAGFCEIGETAEQTVQREVEEEVGLNCRNMTYFGSQPWGIDSNLLLGYYAELCGNDEIKLDTSELSKAEWVTRGELEKQTNLVSLTAAMIENFRIGNI